MDFRLIVEILLRRMGTEDATHEPSRPAPGPAGARSQLAVARGPGVVVVRVIGVGNLRLAPALGELVETEMEAGYRRFVLDLAQCRGLDSTFMGCMVGLAQTLKQAPSAAAPASAGAADSGAEPMGPEEALAELTAQFEEARAKSPVAAGGAEPGFVAVVNVSPQCQDLLTILGVDKFVRLLGCVDLAPLEMAVLPDVELPRETLRRVIRRAHENLVQLDQRNVAHFGAFLKHLAGELGKQN